jgi:uncharacterized membrane protein YcaP (DUF421 family)
VHWLTGDWTHLGEVAGKAALMYATALLALRLGERRTLAQWTIIDVATAVAMGAIVGRTAIAGTQSYITGAVAVVALVVVHRIISALRFTRAAAKLVDHRVRVLVVDGDVRHSELRKCAITENDLYAHLRQQGYFNLDGIKYVLYETKGDLTVVPVDAGQTVLVAAGLHNAAGWPPDQG